MNQATPSDSRIFIDITVKTNAMKDEVIGWENNRLKIAIRQVREKGKANEALIAFLSKFFRISKSSIEILSGNASTHKKLCIYGVCKETIESINFTKHEKKKPL